MLDTSRKTVSKSTKLVNARQLSSQELAKWNPQKMAAFFKPSNQSQEYFTMPDYE
ncbi:hypothetical protein HCH29_13325 [Enterococcus gilvus]|nr:hypothetical protein [Enterococcus gilvus]